MTSGAMDGTLGVEEHATETGSKGGGHSRVQDSSLGQEAMTGAGEASHQGMCLVPPWWRWHGGHPPPWKTGHHTGIWAVGTGSKAHLAPLAHPPWSRHSRPEGHAHD